MGKIKGNDCCCSDWKSIIKELWARCQSMVTKIAYAGNVYTPDGEGKITLPTPIITSMITLFLGEDFCILAVSEGSSATLTNNTTYWTLEVNA